MKIALIGQKGMPAIHGGIETHVEELSIKLAELNQDVTVFSRYYYSKPSMKLLEKKNDDYFYKGVRIKLLPSINTKNLDAITHTFNSSFYALFKDYDVIHFHGIGPSLFSFLPRIFNKKTVSTIHGLDWQREKWGKFASKMLIAGELASINFPNKTIVVSKALKKYYLEKYKKDVIYITNGVQEPPLLSPDVIKKKYNLNGGDYILFVGRLVPEKSCHILMEAFKEIKTDLRLVIVGGSSHSDAYVTMLKKAADNDSRVILTGYIDRNELHELFTNCYLFVLPSEVEGLPIALLEALSYQLPVLVSDIPANMEVVSPGDTEEKYGFSFEKGNIKDLKQKLELLIREKDMTFSIKSKVKDYILKNYNWDSIAREVLDVYNSK